MPYRSFPELNRQQVKHLLRNGFRIDDANSYLCDTARKLAELDVIEMQEYKYVLCVNPDDPDYQSVEDFRCEERIYFDSVEDMVDCSACGRYIEDLSEKQVFVEHEISLNTKGVSSYAKKAFSNVSGVVSVHEVKKGVYEVEFQNTLRLMIVMPEICSDLEYRSRGLFFAEPCAYLTISSLHCDTHTVLEQNQHLKLSDLLCESASNIRECLKLAAVPIVERRYFGDISARFDVMMERHKSRGWQFFEQDFIHKSCSLINESKVPKASTESNDLIVKVGPSIAKTMHQNVVAFDASNGMLNGNPDVADGPVIGLLVSGERRLRVVLALARLFVGQEQFCACIIGTDAQVA